VLSTQGKSQENGNNMYYKHNKGSLICTDIKKYFKEHVYPNIYVSHIIVRQN